MIRPSIILFLFLFAFKAELRAGLLINEFVTNASGDWVELCLAAPAKEKMNISDYYVTMYYGSNEKLGQEPITIYSYDRPETPYDDRFIVVHLTSPDTPDETDWTGDTNGNGFIDVYCNNYSASLWNSDGIVAVDSDDDPSNGGILDFVYYSNRDGGPNETMASYVESAQNQGQWSLYSGENIQECAVSIGAEGLEPYMSISRVNQNDTNTANDFAVTNVQTPGKPNITLPLFMGNKLFKPLRRTIVLIPGHALFGMGEFPLFVFIPSFIKFRVFSITGVLLHESPLYPSVQPGFFNLYWCPLLHRSRYTTGLYLCKIEAVSPTLRRSEEEIIYIILSRYP
jgi:hypothetical protein